MTQLAALLAAGVAADSGDADGVAAQGGLPAGGLEAGLEAVELAIRTAVLALGGSLLGRLLAADGGHRGPRIECGVLTAALREADAAMAG